MILFPFVPIRNVSKVTCRVLNLLVGCLLCSMSICTSFVVLMSTLFLENACPYFSHSSSNPCLTSTDMSLSCSYTLQGPGTSAGEQIKAVSGGISGNVLCLWGTQLCGLAKCSLMASSLASCML